MPSLVDLGLVIDVALGDLAGFRDALLAGERVEAAEDLLQLFDMLLRQRPFVDSPDILLQMVEAAGAGEGDAALRFMTAEAIGGFHDRRAGPILEEEAERVLHIDPLGID